MSELKPGVPDVLAELEIDRKAPSFKAQLGKFAKKLETLLAKYQVEAYVIARRDQGSVMHLVVLPCASAPEQRAERFEGEAADAAKSRAKTAEGIIDAVEQAGATAKSADSAFSPGTGLAPAGDRGVAIRRKR